MLQIALAKKTEYRPGKDKKNGQVVVEPLFTGFGMTMGNSIRRVLLSSLPGAAPVGVKITGVDHEFMTLPHLKEDILEVILKLKKLQVKVYTDEIEKIEIEVHGEKTITAGDFKKNSNVEIANPELEIGHITDMSGSFKAELFVSKGMGYEMIESRESKNSEIGYIEMDSIFTPIYKCALQVENTRVGKMTNWERLILDIETDGTIGPDEAFTESVQILIEQFVALGGNPEARVEQEKEASEAAKIEEKEEDKIEKEDKKEEKIESEEKPKRGRPKKS